MKHLLVIYGRQSGRTHAMCDAVCEGAAAAAEDVELRCRYAPEAGIGDLLWADGLLLGTPENFGYMSGLLKDFFDRTFYPAEGKTVAKPYALFVSAGNDGSGAVRAVERIAIGYGWKAVAEPLVVKGGLDDSALQRCRDLGEAMAAALSAGIF